MKLPKTLLSAIVVGIAVQSAASCNKTALTPAGQKQNATEVKSAGRPTTTKPVNFTDSCPACGMG